MQPRVTAVLVARNGVDFLERTLPALAVQSRKPDSMVFVDAGSTDGSADVLKAARPAHFVATSSRRSFGGSVADAVAIVSPGGAQSPDEWLWLLAHDSAPHPRALEALLAAIEIAPSVAIAGPKLMRWDRPDTIAEYGETMTRFGASIALVENELDQAQHDEHSDVLAVAAKGMLVRASVWTALGGFDPALPSMDASLDFSVRARLAGHRVIVVPEARIASAGGPELFGRRSVSARARFRLSRAAQLHRRLTYSNAIALPVHWLALIPLALGRSIVHLARKRPTLISAEFGTAFAAAVSGRPVASRRNLSRTRVLGWSAIAPLRMSTAAAREHRAQQRETVASAIATIERPRIGFLAGGGAWVLLMTAAISLIAFGPFLGAAALTGGGIVPLSSTIGTLWSHVGYGWHDVGGGFSGASDPFAAVLAVLGSVTFWAPSTSVVVIYVLALPLSALGAWLCARELVDRAWPAAVAGISWSLALPLLSSMTAGHLGGVIAHILLPWLVLGTLRAARSWSAGAVAAVLFAAVVASAPILAPALVVALVAWIIARPTGVIRLVGIVIPAAALFAPLVIDQVRRGNLLGVLAEPGIPVLSSPAAGWHLALGSPDTSLAGWGTFAGSNAALVLACVLVPFVALALLSIFLPGSRRAIPSMLIALLGFATAVVATRIELSIVGAHTASVWPGAGLSLMWLGLTGAVVASLEAFGRGATLPGLVVAVLAGVAAVPLLVAPIAGTSAVSASSTGTLPAFVEAEAANLPTLGTLQLDAQSAGGLAVTLHRGQGTTLDEYSTLASTATAASATDTSLATIAGNLASRSGLDLASALDQQNIAFVLLPHNPPTASGAADAVRQRTADALDGNRVLTPIGDTAQGLLWRYDGLAATTAAAPPALQPPFGIAIAIGQGLIFFITLMLAIPSGRRRGRSRATLATDTDERLGEGDDE